jgi:hypothetical protein
MPAQVRHRPSGLHSVAVPRWPVVTMRVLSGLTATACSGAPVRRRSVSRPLAASQTRSVRSRPAVTTDVSSGVNVAAAGPVCRVS